MTVTNESLKEYYIKLQALYDNCYNILTAIDQSLSTNAPEITVNVTDTDDAVTTLRIPSFLYMENKLEQIENNMSALFSMPNSGEAWFNKSSDMYKLELVRSGTAPLIPEVNSENVYAGFKESALLRDMVSPHTYLRLQIDNLPEAAKQMFMRKIIIYDKQTFDALQGLDIHSYDEWQAALYNYTKGQDYEEYDSTIDLPIRKDTYKSQFKILEIPRDSWLDPVDNNHKHLSYELRLDTLEYTDEENSEIRFTLKAGDYVCLGNEMAVYLVKNVDTTSNSIVIEEQVGHISLQTFEENSQMILQLYNDNYGKYKYVDVPLEENRFVCIFLGVLYNNVRSILSDAYLVDLTTIYMKDESGNIMQDSFGNPLSYIDYYNEYCTNIGDLILGLTEAAYPQLSNYSGQQLKSLQESEELQTVVSATIDNEQILQVVPINKHLTDDVSSQEIINLHAQKNDLQAQLSTVNDNISQVYNTLTTTDFSQQTSNSINNLQSKLRSYYTERTSLQKQLNSIIDSINAKSLDVAVTGNDVKYRIRGVANTDDLETLIHSIADAKADIIGMEVEYKYKSTTKDTDSVTVINSSTFTDWNRQDSIDRQRKLIFDTNVRSWHLVYIDYKNTDNVIKWNQIDIPIKAGEDVIVRVRYKYNIGQPFVNIVTPWSDELTVVFPSEYKDDVEMNSILDMNRRDTIIAGFRSILINEGYEEHINNKVVSSDQIFFHMPENIYSGFTTAENNLISLKDKLLQMSQDIAQYKSWVEGESNTKFEVYLQYDEQTTLLAPNNINKINIYNTDHITGTFIKKNMNIVIRNTGKTRVNFYSIFPGNVNISLLKTNIDNYNQYIVNYERVPLIIDNHIALQNLGQWIYFRQTNPYTNEDIYLNTAAQRNADRNVALDTITYDEYGRAVVNETIAHDLVWLPNTAVDYMMLPNKQCLLGYRDRTGVQINYDSVIKNFSSTMQTMLEYMQMIRRPGNVLYDGRYNDEYSDEEWQAKLDEAEAELTKGIENITNYDGIFSDIYNTWSDDDFVYVNSKWCEKESTSPYYDGGINNKYIMRYEDIVGKNQSTGALVYIDSSTSIVNFLNDYQPKGFTQDTDFSGAFLYPELLSRASIMTEGGSNDHIYIDEGEQLTIPIVFEYYLDGNKTATVDHTKVTKSIYFDLRNSLIKNPIHYMIEVTGNYDFTSTGDMYSNFATVDLEDDVTNKD